MAICPNWAAKDKLNEQCKAACVKPTQNCGNCKSWDWEKGRCKHDSNQERKLLHEV